MDQLAVSELQQITVEIKVLKHQTAQNIIEIGKRLKVVRDNPTYNGQWESWLMSIDIEPSTAWRMIEAYKQFGHLATSQGLSTSKVFEMITLPESVDRQEFVEQSHMIPSTGESKTVDEMTVKELREVKRSLREAEQRAERAEAERKRIESQAIEVQRTNRTLREQNEQLKREKNPEPQVIEKVVEIVPERYKQLEQEYGELHTKHFKLVTEVYEIQRSYEKKLRDVKDGDSKSAKRQLRQALDQHLANIQSLHSSALFLYRIVEGHEDATKMVRTFLTQFDDITTKQRNDWSKILQVNGADDAVWLTI